MPKEQYLVGLDIGTQNIRVVQAKAEETGGLTIIGTAHVESSGMRKGVIADLEEVVSCISSALEKLERMTGVPVSLANVSVGGSHIACIESKGVIAVSRADGEISESDIIRVIDASQAISIPPNREVIHVIPKTFTLDGQTGIKDPLGMSGIRLEVETLIIHGAMPFLRNLNKAVTQTGLEPDQLVLAPLAAAQATLTKRQKELGVALIDLGAGTTSLAVYEENNLIHTAVLPIGRMHITNDLAIGLRSSIETAEKVKLAFGNATVAGIDKHQQIDLSKFDPEEQGQISRSSVVEIIEARLEEIFEYVNREFKTIGRDGKLPAGIVLTGGGSGLPGITEFTKKQLRLPCQIGSPQNITSVIDHVAEPGYATVVGLVLWGELPSGGGSSSLPNAMRGLFENQKVVKLKKWFKSFLP